MEDVPMGVWGAGNFDNDAALDYAHELTSKLVKQVQQTVGAEHGMEPDERSSAVMMCNVELLWHLGRHVGLSMLEWDEVECWKQKYLEVWDSYIDRLRPNADFKEERRKVIAETFDRLIELCREQEG